MLSKEKAMDFIDQYESIHSIAVIKENIRDNIRQQQKDLNALELLVNDFLMQSQSISKQYPLMTYEIIASKPTEIFGKSIGELNLWQQTGATVVAIEHNGELLKSPGPYAVIEKGDHIYFVGDDDVYSRMKTFFNLTMGL